KTFPCCWGLHVSIPKQEYTVNKGEDVELICNFNPAVPIANNFLLTWDAYPDVTGAPLKTVASYFLNSPVDIAPNYEGRASLEVNVERKTSTLRLTGVTMKDSRHYQCSVKISGDDEGTTELSHLGLPAPPSPPICRIQGKVEYYHDINLTCMSEEGSPKPVYTWTTFSVENIPRQFPPKTTQKDGVLSLYNISRETSGFFICTSKNSIAVASCNVTLAVVPGEIFKTDGRFRCLSLKARTHRDEFRPRYSQTFNASSLKKGHECECAHRLEKRHASKRHFEKPPRVRFLV
uniref:Ig-like domain-containing protein n=1 Tax=Oryzias sinensis TaxID=183150 RepID=A0A8C7ZG40_9TELE